MTKIEELLRSLENKTDDEKRDYLSKRFNLYWDIPEGPCKIWCAEVFTYCNASEFEEELKFFLFWVNIFAHLCHFCFHQEDTNFLGCTCPCGNKQTVLYYSITCGD
ncbi:hypothetical protein [Anaerotignum sp. MB30-C6]|uniref:hypothetical protein n=1 Tax=Anaerotignum sp. MB30-C6 TaxID=3070814 RepID=UPI0027DE048C|nr:hypothetical protein [Anaerotignum sp. MB30-C6]WMI80581.1 hypothetical protein RBQ60_12195 [Anaerotignum sp. MB30-C6]